MAKHVHYVAVVDGHPARMSFGHLIHENKIPGVFEGQTLDGVLGEVDDGYENRVVGLYCVDLDTGAVEALDAQRELDAWRDEHMSVDEERALMPVR